MTLEATHQATDPAEAAVCLACTLADCDGGHPGCPWHRAYDPDGVAVASGPAVCPACGARFPVTTRRWAGRRQRRAVTYKTRLCPECRAVWQTMEAT